MKSHFWKQFKGLLPGGPLKLHIADHDPRLFQDTGTNRSVKQAANCVLLKFVGAK